MSMRKEWKGGVPKPTNLHDLQLTLHFIVIAVLFDPLLEMINLGGLQHFGLGGFLEALETLVYQTLDFAGILLAFLLQRLLLGMY